jgi:hypothetical protein
MAVTIVDRINGLSSVSNVTTEETEGGYDIVLLVGQSNCVGFAGNAAIDEFLDWPHDRIFQWSPDGGLLTNEEDEPEGQFVYAQKLIKAADPLRFPAFAGQTDYELLWGPSAGTHFARNALIDTAGNRSYVLIPTAVGGTGLVDSSWQSTVPIGALFQQAVDAATTAVNTLPNARVTHIIWIQGENESQIDPGTVSPAQYQTELDATLTAFRTLIPNATDAQIHVVQMVPDWIEDNADTTQAEDIDQVHRETPLRIANSWFVHGLVGGFKAGDLIHYNAAAARVHGKRIADKARALTALDGGANLTAPLDLSAVGATISWTVPTSDAPLYQIEARAAGSSGAWTTVTYSPATYVEPGDTVSYTLDSLSGAIDVRVAGRILTTVGPYSNTIEVEIVSVPTPWVELDFDNLVDAAGDVTEVPSIGTDTTAWTATAGNEPAFELLNSKKILVTTASNAFLSGPAFPRPAPAQPYTMMVMVYHTNFTGSGTYLCPTGTLGSFLFWRNSGSAKPTIGHDGTGDALQGSDILTGQWYNLTCVYDPTLLTNNLKLYINGTLDTQITVDQTLGDTSSGTALNALFGGGGNNGKYAAVKLWDEALNNAQVAQETAQIADVFGVVL